MVEGIELHGRRIQLRPIVEEKDVPILYRWRNDISSLYLWSVRRHIVTFREFVEEFRQDLLSDRHVQMIIETNQEEAVGTIYSYNANFIDNHCFITTYIVPGKTGCGYGVEALTLFVNYLFTYFNFYKIYMEVYEYNELSCDTLQNAGFAQEGRFKEHHLYNGKRYDLLRFALYYDRLPEIKNFIKKLKKQGGEQHG